MHSLSSVPTLQKEFPEEILYELRKLPLEMQIAFLNEYQISKLQIGVGYLFHFFGLSYAYQGKWFKQVLSWLTVYGLGIWWLINCIRLPSSIKKENLRKAKRIIHKLKKRRSSKIDESFLIPIKKKNLEKILDLLQPQPHPLNIKFDPSNLSVEHLQKGFLVDYSLTTWLVVDEYQYDFLDGTIEKGVKIVSENDGIDTLYLQTGAHENFRLVKAGKIVNIHSISSTLQHFILTERQAPNTLTYKGVSYFKESSRKGILYYLNHPAKDRAKKICCWEFLDEQRNSFLRIEWIDEWEFLCLHGKIVPRYAFSDILPAYNTKP
ncbi:MAG: DUF4178 domain-containing protein [Flammeovirgaceae bacterium]|nr:DUF4178 domain-containing protein [Flammeovirgaceae bacterium]MDW8286439.1 DUF4178 domain-containing protein [Flammeovirgaceae bacterium]